MRPKVRGFALEISTPTQTRADMSSSRAPTTDTPANLVGICSEDLDPKQA
jgi:hypothetical protein